MDISKLPIQDTIDYTLQADIETGVVQTISGKIPPQLVFSKVKINGEILFPVGDYTIGNSYTGGTDIYSGIVEVGHNNAFGTGKINYYGGTISTVSSTSGGKIKASGNDNLPDPETYVISNPIEFQNLLIRFGGNNGMVSANVLDTDSRIER